MAESAEFILTILKFSSCVNFCATIKINLLQIVQRFQRKRNRVFDHINFNEKELSAPFSSPKWTLSSYNGRLKDIVQSAINPNIQETEEIKQAVRTG
jgi:hypothetical protein